MQKILIIRFSSIGDIILTSPVIRCVKQQLESEVHYVTKEAYCSILASNPNVDKVHSFKKEITEIVGDLKNEEFDFVIDLHNNLRSTRLKRLLNVKSAAFPKLNRQKFLLTQFKKDVMPKIHIVDRYFEAAKSLGVKNDMQGLDYFIPEADKVEPISLNLPSEYIAFSIGAQFATKRLPNHKIIEIISALKAPVVLLGGKEDSENANSISAACDCMNLVGQLNLNQSASLIEQATSVITHDTGLMHIAAAFNKKIVSVWGNTTPKFGMYPYLPQNPNNYSAHEVELKCRPCSKIGYQKCPKGHFNCMEQQNVTEIVNAINLQANT